MNQTHLQDQEGIKILPEDESVTAHSEQIVSSKATRLPEGCVVMPMKILAQPEPIKPQRGPR